MVIDDEEIYVNGKWNNWKEKKIDGYRGIRVFAGSLTMTPFQANLPIDEVEGLYSMPIVKGLILLILLRYMIIIATLGSFRE